MIIKQNTQLSRASSAIHQTTCPLSCDAVFGWSMSLFTVHRSLFSWSMSLFTVRLINVNVSTASKWSDQLLRRLDRLIWWPEKKLTGLICTHTQLSLAPLLFKDLLCFLANPKPKLLSFIGSLPCCWSQWLQCWQPSTFNSFATFLNFQVSLDNASCTWMCNAQRTLNTFCATCATCARLEHVVSFRQRGACSVCHRVCHKKWRCHNCQRGGKCNNVTPLWPYNCMSR